MSAASITLEADVQNVGVARDFVRRSLEGNVEHGAIDDLVLATSELVTNAIEHGRRPPIIVTAGTDHSAAFVSVRSAGDANGLAEVAAWRTALPDRVSGRGLGIVATVADDVRIVRDGDEVEITVVKRRLADH